MVPVTSSDLVESAANTFTAVEVDLSSHFNTAELRRGVYPVGWLCDINKLPSASGASTSIQTHVVWTKSVQTALQSIASSVTLAKKTLMGGSGAAAGTINFQVAKEYPGGGSIFADRVAPIDANDPKTHLNIQSSGLGSANGANAILFFTVKVPAG
jgi:hypothetical protein